jgi:hypothetical protein
MSQKPTEEEVRRKVWSRNSSKNVTLRSPLMEVPDLYFAKNNRPVDPAAVACYVAIRSGPPAQPTEPPGKTTIQLVVIGRDSGQQNAKDRGKITEYQIIEQWAARDAFGPDWLAKHPWPKDPDAGGSGGE